MNTEQHPDDIAVDQFAVAMKAKLAKQRSRGYSGWEDPLKCSTDLLHYGLLKHIYKGDPVDVGNFARMLFNRNELTS